MEIPLLDAPSEALAHARAVLDTFFVAPDGVFARKARIERTCRGLRLFGWKPEPAALDALYARACEGACGRVVRLVLGADATGRLVAWRELRAPHREPVALRLVHWPFAPPPRPAKFAHDYALARLAAGGELGDAAQMALFCWEGKVLSASFGNFFVRVQGRWLTPPAGAGVLAGCVRNALLARGAAEECAIPLATLSVAEAAAITASGSFVRAVRAIDARSLALSPVEELRAALRGMPGAHS